MSIQDDASELGPEPLPSLARKLGFAAVSGLGGFIVVFLLAQATASLHTVLLIAPFGASCVLVFALPHSPLAQPRNVIGGHLVSATVGVCVCALFGAVPWSFGLAVGLAIALMELTGTLHPPAGADPIVVILAKAGWMFLLSPVLAGAVLIVATAFAYHRVFSQRPYPIQ
ncbi:MAG: HPP family protein [Rhizomicrobium sp.]